MELASGPDETGVGWTPYLWLVYVAIFAAALADHRATSVHRLLGVAASIVFLFTFSSFGVVLLLGGPTRATLETEIYLRATELVTIPACEPVNEIASWPRSWIAIAASAQEIRSPTEISMSSSRGFGRGEIS